MLFRSKKHFTFDPQYVYLFYIGHDWISLTSLFRFRFPGYSNKWWIDSIPLYCELYSLLQLNTCVYVYMYVYTYTYLLFLISMLWHRQAIFESKGDQLSSFAECRIRTQRVSETQSPADWMPADKPTELSRIKLKKVELDSPSLWSTSIQPTWPHCNLSFASGSGNIYTVELL